VSTPPGLLPSERRAIALVALGRSSAEILAQLVQEGLPIPRGGLGAVWSGAAEKLGARRVQWKGRQPELVYLAHVHGCLDAPVPEDPGPLSPDVLRLLQALAAGKTLQGYARELGVRRMEVEALSRYARTMFGVPSLASLVYRALPQLVLAERGGTASRVATSPVVTSLQTDLPGDESAIAVSRGWIRSTHSWLRWTGSVAHAAEVGGLLVANAVRHGLPDDVALPGCHLLLRSSATEAGELLLDVTDHNPLFPGFDRAVGRTGSGRGLRRIAWIGAQVSWTASPDGIGKTVRATFPPARPAEESA